MYNRDLLWQSISQAPNLIISENKLLNTDNGYSLRTHCLEKQHIMFSKLSYTLSVMEPIASS